MGIFLTGLTGVRFHLFQPQKAVYLRTTNYNSILKKKTNNYCFFLREMYDFITTKQYVFSTYSLLAKK